MSGPSVWRSWLRDRPLAEDALLSVALLILPLALTLPNTPQTPFATTEPTGRVLWLVAAACAALVLRRRFTLLVWVVTLLISAASIGWGGQLAPVPALLVALYTVAAYGTRWVALACSGVSVAVLVPLALAQSTPFNVWVAYGLAAWVGMATAIGVAVRGQRALVAAAEARAAEAERTRQDEARRAVTEERLRIARELHDAVAHHIAVVNVQAGVARHMLASDPKGAAAALTEVRRAAQEALDETSVTLGLLRGEGEREERGPTRSVGDVGPLIDAVRRAGHEVRWRTEGIEKALPASVDLAAYRVVQEALTNAAKHGVGPIDASLQYLPDVVVIEVGNAVQPGAKPAASGHGLVGMTERVSSLGGQVAVHDHGHRFVIRVESPATLRAGVAG